MIPQLSHTPPRHDKTGSVPWTDPVFIQVDSAVLTVCAC